jgi:glucoside 3-dehydrogenase (cytochrome c) hitch-hiker subunit
MNRRELLKSISLLVGGVASGSLTRAVLASSSGRRSPLNPVFDDTTRRKVAIITELIIPTTDTPGAIAAGVPDFIEMMVGEWYTGTEKTAFFQGLKDLDAWCQGEYGVLLLEASEAQRITCLEAFERRAAEQLKATGDTNGSAAKVDENAPFFTSIRELVVVGYYTSEVGARQEHKWFRMSPEYDGDYPLASTDGRQWSY